MSPGSSPMSGYCPTSARRVASALISSIVRSACCCEKHGTVIRVRARSAATDLTIDDLTDDDLANKEAEPAERCLCSNTLDTRQFLSVCKRMGRRESGRVFYENSDDHNLERSEKKLQPQLNSPAPARPDDRVRGGNRAGQLDRKRTRLNPSHL